MSKLQVTRHINAPPETVFARATDMEHTAEIISGIEKVEILTDGPVGLGTRFRETRIMLGREAVEEMEFIVFEPPHRYVLGAASHGSRYRTEFVFAEKEGGTDMTLHFEGTPLTFFAKIMTFLMKPMMKKMADMCAADLEDLKKAIESGA